MRHNNASALDERVGVLQSEMADPAAQEIAFSGLVESFTGELSKVIGSMIGPEETEDLLQETFLDAYRGMGSFEPTAGPRSLRNWLVAIARNRTSKYIRDRESHDYAPAELSGEGPESQVIAGTSSQLADPVAELERKEALASFGELSRPQHEALVLTALGFMPQEISEIQGITGLAARLRLNRGRQAARRLLFEQNPSAGT